MDDNPSLDVVGFLEGTQKSSIWVDFLRHYERHLHAFKDQEIEVLEIGVQGGASLALWRHYFPKATLIGVDINPWCKQFDGGERTIIEIGSQDDPEFLAGVSRKYSPTIIIDDGSHLAHHVTYTFEHLFPFLQPGGLYVIEDIFFHLGPHAEQYRGQATVTLPEYLMELSRALLREGIETEKNFGNLAYFRKSIDEIAFIPNGAAFIRKRATEDTAGLIAQAEAYAEQTGKAIHWVRVADFIQRKGGSAAQAEIAARKATELMRQFPQATKVASQAYVALSRAQSAGGKAEEAIRSATQAAELVPEDAPTLHHLGQLLFEQQAYKAAATAFQKAVEASDTHFPSYKSLSLALQRQKDLPGARSALTRGMAVSRGGPWSDIFKKALSELEPIGNDQAGS